MPTSRSRRISTPSDPAHLEEEKVAGAIKTDFILSAEIMTIALAAIPKAQLLDCRRSRWPWSASASPLRSTAAVALIVKMDDIGLHMAAAGRSAADAGARARPGAWRCRLMAVLSTVGTAAMLWVGGYIVIHGLEVAGLGLALGTTSTTGCRGSAMPCRRPRLWWNGWSTAALDGVFGLALGLLLIPLATRVIGPLIGAVTGKKDAAH